MGRVQQFDTAVVVRAARAVFWAGGYEATSLPDLERATGLSRSSLYHAFGSKRGLFDAVVDSYLGEVVRPRLRALQAPEVAGSALPEYLAGLRAAVADRRTPVARSGCLLLNSAGAPIGQDDLMTGVIAAYREELRMAIGRGLAAASSGTVPASRVEAVTALVVAALVLTRIDPDGALASLDAAAVLAFSTV